MFDGRIKNKAFAVAAVFFALSGAFLRAEDPASARRKVERDRKAAEREIIKKYKLSGTLDLNSANKEQLMYLPGLNEIYAERIIAGRPYRLKAELVYRRIITEAMYRKIAEYIEVRPRR